jgi:phospholipid/cholesterol/gamma-HCH transport system substrate-binding protein
MEKKEIAQQIKVGAFVLAGLALFLISVFFIGSENNVFSRTFTVAAVFRNVEGLKAGDNVWLSGVKIGTVSDVRIVSEGKVVVDLSLKNKQNQFIETDAIASIGSDGLVGSKIVVISPGQSGDMVSEEDTLNTVSPTDTQDLFNIAKDVGENTRSLTADIKTIAERISAGQGIVGELLNDGTIAQEIRAAVENLRSTGSNTAKASAELNMLVSELRSGPGLLPMLIADTAYAQTFSSALENIGKVSTNAALVSERLQDLTTKLNDDNNAVGALLSDSTMAGQIKSTIENAAQASQKLDENMEALQHNFLFRGYFRKHERRQERREERARDAASSKGE